MRQHLYLRSFICFIRHTPGKSNTADYWSRLLQTIYATASDATFGVGGEEEIAAMVSALTDQQGIPDFGSENLVAAQLLSDDDDIAEDVAYFQHSLATLRELRTAEIADDSLGKEQYHDSNYQKSVTEAHLRRSILPHRNYSMRAMAERCCMVRCVGLG